MASRQVPENIRGYPENRMFGPSLSAYGLFVRHVRDLTLDDVHFNLLPPDARPALVFDDVDQVELAGLVIDASDGEMSPIQTKDSKGISIEARRVRGTDGRLKN